MGGSQDNEKNTTQKTLISFKYTTEPNNICFYSICYSRIPKNYIVAVKYTGMLIEVGKHSMVISTQIIPLKEIYPNTIYLCKKDSFVHCTSPVPLV